MDAKPKKPAKKSVADEEPAFSVPVRKVITNAPAVGAETTEQPLEHKKIEVASAPLLPLDKLPIDTSLEPAKPKALKESPKTVAEAKVKAEAAVGEVASPPPTPEAKAPEPTSEEVKSEEPLKKAEPDSSKPPQAEDSKTTATAPAVTSESSKPELKAKAEPTEENDSALPAKTDEAPTPKLFDTEKYHLPIKERSSASAGHRTVVFLVVFVLVAAAALYLLIDAGKLDIGVKLPFDLIK